MQDGAFAGVIADPLAGRSAKPRRTGLTMVIDKGLGLRQTEDLMELAAPYIDLVKLGFGTSALYSGELLRRKIERIHVSGVTVYPGGTFTEIAWMQRRLPEFLDACLRLGFGLVEVSDGTVSLAPAERLEIIRTARARGLAVITEVGKKAAGQVLDPIQALRQIEADLEAGAEFVILEGRESGRGAGLYDPQGRFREDDVELILAGLPEPHRVMWEAPLKEQQQAFIARCGPNVSLGNVPPGEVLALEALRRGLRSDTLRPTLAESAPGR